MISVRMEIIPKEKANQSIEGATNMQGRKNFILADIINLTKPRILRNVSNIFLRNLEL